MSYNHCRLALFTVLGDLSAVFLYEAKRLMEWGNKQEFCIMELYLKNCPSKAWRVNAEMNKAEICDEKFD